MIEKILWADMKALLATGVKYHSFQTNNGSFVVYAYDGGLIVCELNDIDSIEYQNNFLINESKTPLHEGHIKRQVVMFNDPKIPQPVLLKAGQVKSYLLPEHGWLDLIHINANRRDYRVGIKEQGFEVASWDVKFLMDRAGLDIDRVRAYPIYLRTPGLLSIGGPVHFRWNSELFIEANKDIRYYGQMEFTT